MPILVRHDADRRGAGNCRVGSEEVFLPILQAVAIGIFPGTTLRGLRNLIYLDVEADARQFHCADVCGEPLGTGETELIGE